MKSAVVTGASGFLGSTLANHLAEQGYTVFAIIHSINSDISRIEKKPNINIIYSNIESIPEHITAVPDFFFHFAWEGSAGKKRADEVVQLNNVVSTCTAIRIAKQINCKRFIFASSVMEYEYEEALKKGYSVSLNNLYSAAKLTARKMGTILAHSLSIDFVPIIISNIFGENENSPRLINTTIKKMLNGEKTSFTDGNQMYDFIYIKDAVCAFISIAEKGKSNTAYYLGSLNPKPLKYFLDEVHRCVAPNSPLGLGDIPFSGASLDYYEIFDINAVKNDTGFIPQFSFTEGILNTMNSLKGDTL